MSGMTVAVATAALHDRIASTLASMPVAAAERRSPDLDIVVPLAAIDAVLAALSSPPADDVREAAQALADATHPPYPNTQGWSYEDAAAYEGRREGFVEGYVAAAEVRPYGTVTDRPADEPRVLSIVAEIVSERGRQDAKWGAPHDVPDGTGPAKRMLGHTFAALRLDVQAWVDRAAAEGTSTMSTILLEEVFEALAESDEQKLRAELIQVAAVAAKWVQIIDAREVEL